jgi:hypothetical protein
MKAAALIGALSISFYTLLLFSFSFSPARTHHVVFKEIGEMAGALSYIHIIVPINISGLLQAVTQFQEKVNALKAGYIDKKLYAERLDRYGGVNMNGPQQHALFHFRRQITYLIYLMLTNADTIQGSIESLRASLPKEEDAPGRSQQHEMRVKRHTLLFISTALSGVFGMLMGWFTHRQLNNLRNQIGEVHNQQHWLMQIQQVTLSWLDDLETVLREVVQEMERSETTWVNHFALDHGRIQLHFYIQKLTRAVQAAHLCCLSVDLLDSAQLRHIFDMAAQKAKAHQYQLMLRHPSDLFLIETSYLHNGQDMHLILHVPMAPADSILWLFQLHPFPLPFTETHFVMPDPSNQILAISSGINHLSMEMSVANLMGCHHINSAYLCERHGIMRRELNSTCLGSLYVQDFSGANQVCELKIVEQNETVLQLQDNWYLVYSPTAFTSYFICLNKSNSEVFIKMGPNRIFISPSCRMRLKAHVLISDFSLRLDSVIKHYEWDLDEIAFSSEERTVSLHWLEILGMENVGRTTLNSIRQDLEIEQRSTSWLFIFCVIGALVAAVLTIIVLYGLIAQLIITLKMRILGILLCTLQAYRAHDSASPAGLCSKPTTSLGPRALTCGA